MFAQTKTFLELFELVLKLKAKYGLKLAVVSNEARELNAYRIRQFKLDGLVDALISSDLVGLRKPDADICRLAPDIAQTPAAPVVDIENTPLVRPDRGRIWDWQHSTSGLQIPMRATGFARIEV